MCGPTTFALRVKEVTKLCSRMEGDKKEEIDSYPPIIDIKNKKFKGSTRCCHCLLGSSPLTNFLDTSKKGTFLVFPSSVPNFYFHFLCAHPPLQSFCTCLTRKAGRKQRELGVSALQDSHFSISVSGLKGRIPALCDRSGKWIS